MKDQVILFVCHSGEESVLGRYRKLKTEMSDCADVYFVCHDNMSIWPGSSLSSFEYFFTDDKLKELPFPMAYGTIVPGSAHFPLFLFMQDYPEYSYYWFVEYDVCFTGS